MANIGLLPLDDEGCVPRGKFLTFVVPAQGGCNLECAGCFVQQRLEVSETCLRPADYARFVAEVARGEAIFALGIQGHEPLLPGSRHHTQAILNAGHQRALPTSLVTNGVFLRKAVQWLNELPPTKIGVSLDSPVLNLHDAFRGVRGAWQATVDGIKAALTSLHTCTSLSVVSILMPSDTGRLREMPKLLTTLGISHWIVTPQMQVGTDRAGGPVDALHNIFANLLVLQDAAEREGILLTVDDELDALGYATAATEHRELRDVYVRTLPAGVDLYRLTPGGDCSAGMDVLQVASTAQRWRPGVVDANDFLATIRNPGNSLSSTKRLPGRATKLCA